MSTDSRNRRKDVDVLLADVNEQLERAGYTLRLDLHRWNFGDRDGMRSLLITENGSHEISRTCSTLEMYEGLYILKNVLRRIECGKGEE